jgi:hypothetical protein
MAQQANHPLPSGFQLDEYRIEHQLSLGGFSIVYLATDARGTPSRSRNICPIRWPARRRADHAEYSDDSLPAFRYGMKCFFEEGRALAKLNRTRTSCACSTSSAPTKPSTW